MQNTKNKLMMKSLLVSTLLSFSALSSATIVEVTTSQGPITVNLFDKTTPKTVENFLNYVDENHYTDSVIHRVVTDFIVQGGGFEFTGAWPLAPLAANASITNEPVYSNVKGTIAMAKRGGNVNSATNQWFFNLEDNSANLDVQNGGFTAFGQVIGDASWETLEKIAQLSRCNQGGLTDIPVVKEESQTCADLSAPGIENFVQVQQVTIIDSSEVTDANLTPKKNTLIINQPTTPDSSKSSGGSFGWLALSALAFIGVRRRLSSK
ncbi:peptidylprolyl isomerase [Colwellia sp. D2M02]|uniref:peptidylprolyl isomerase n=1 Tax=Colwellia sp. D2M02 TaxID=2841562 RepID=UPI00209199EC|nr:peptidylprolyl isomerase [Colwellia sp. D2M02]